MPAALPPLLPHQGSPHPSALILRPDRIPPAPLAASHLPKLLPTCDTPPSHDVPPPALLRLFLTRVHFSSVNPIRSPSSHQPLHSTKPLRLQIILCYIPQFHPLMGTNHLHPAHR